MTLTKLVSPLALTSPEEFIPVLSDCLSDSDKRIRVQSVRVLGELCAQGKCNRQPIESAVTDSDPEVGAAATNALRQIPFSSRD
jgi:HEAT repeat protein